MDDTVSRFNTLVVSYGEDVTTSTTESFFGSFEAFFKAFQVGSPLHHFVGIVSHEGNCTWVGGSAP